MKCKLKDLGIVSTGNTPSKSNEAFYDAENIGFIKPDALSDCRVTEMIKTTEYISENARSKARIVGKGTVLVTCIGSIGKIGLADKEFAFNQQINAIQPNERVISKYLAYCMLFNKKSLQTIANAPVVPIINKSQFEEFEVEIEEDKEKQKKVVEVLDELMLIIKDREKQLLKLDNLIKSRFVEMFGDPILNPKEWEVVTIGDVVTDVRYGTSKPAVEGGKYPYLRMNNLTVDGHLDLKDLKYIDIPEDEIEKCIVRKGDVLFNRTNSIELVGKTAVFDLAEDMVIAGYVIRVRLNDRILPEVLSQYMNLEVLKEILRSMAKGAVNQANINAKELQSIKIYIPPMELQKEFVRFVHQIDKLKLKSQLTQKYNQY